jgi:hypothetical protein
VYFRVPSVAGKSPTPKFVAWLTMLWLGAVLSPITEDYLGDPRPAQARRGQAAQGTGAEHQHPAASEARCVRSSQRDGRREKGFGEHRRRLAADPCLGVDTLAHPQRLLRNFV